MLHSKHEGVAWDGNRETGEVMMNGFGMFRLSFKGFGCIFKAFESPFEAFGCTYKALCWYNDSLLRT